MKLWLPPADIARVLRIVAQHLDRAGLPADLAHTGWVGGAPVTLPGFSLLEPVGGVWPLSWFVPESTNLAQAKSLYEAYSAIRLTKTRPKSQVLAEGIEQAALRRLLDRKPKLFTDWFETAAILIALIAMFSEREVTFGAQGVLRLVCDSGTFRASSTKMWSNDRYLRAQVGHAATDFDLAALTIDPLVTDHPLAVTLVRVGAPVASLLAAHVAIAQQGMERGHWLRPRAVAPRDTTAPRPRGRPRVERQVTKDMAQEAHWFVNHNRKGVGEELARILVPKGVSKNTLARLLGPYAYNLLPLTPVLQAKVKLWLADYL